MMNKITGYKLLLWSEEPGKLFKFYTDVLGLKPRTHLTLKDDFGYDLRFPDGASIWIGKHSKVKGDNKDKFRFIITLYVKDVGEWYEKLKNRKDVKILTELFVTPPTRGKKEKRYCFTFLDPEGNCLHFMTKK